MIETWKRIAGCIALLPVMLAVGCDSTNAASRRPQPAVLYLSFGDSTTAGPSTRDYTEFLSEKLDTTADQVGRIEGVHRLIDDPAEFRAHRRRSPPLIVAISLREIQLRLAERL